MKKKILTAMIAAALLAMLTACGSSADTSTGDSGKASSDAAQTTQQNDAGTADKKSDGKMEGSGTLADKYDIKITGAKTCKDYEGNPAILISYTWTNNSDETTSPMGSLMEEAFQDGKQLDPAICDFEMQDSSKEARPGTTLEVETAYSMPSTSKVEFELSAIEEAFESTVPMVTQDFDPTQLEAK